MIRILFTLISIAFGFKTQLSIDERITLTQTKWGFNMFVDKLDRGISSTILKDGFHNDPIINVLLNYLSNGKVFIHIGTHVGIETMAVAHHIKQNSFNSTIYAFQPQFFAYTLLLKSIVFNDFQSFVKLYHRGIAIESGSGEIAVRLIDTGKAEIMKVDSTKRKADDRQTVILIPIQEVVPLDTQIGLVLISANKMQVQILESLLIYCEMSREMVIISDWKYGINPQKSIDQIIQIINKLENLNYQIYEIMRENEESMIKGFRRLVNFSDMASIRDSKIIIIPDSKKLPDIQ